MLPKRYDKWIKFVFDRPTQRDWYFKNDDEFTASAAELVALYTHTCLHCSTDLQRYSVDELYDGLNYMFNNACSNSVFCFADTGRVPLPVRLTAIQAIKTLYRDCFVTRCQPILSHVDHQKTSGNNLNAFCDMMWDITPIPYWDA
jgi:hypothetical protein